MANRVHRIRFDVEVDVVGTNQIQWPIRVNVSGVYSPTERMDLGRRIIPEQVIEITQGSAAAADLLPLLARVRNRVLAWCTAMGQTTEEGQ